jgi:hypothetical protein
MSTISSVFSSPSSIILVAGLIFILVGLLGGGIEIKELKIAQLSVFPRVACFLVGSVLTGWVLFEQHKSRSEQESKNDRYSDLGVAITNHRTDVQKVKTDLKQLGMYVGPINSEPEVAYFLAVAKFQQSRNIDPAEGRLGLVDDVTFEHLRKALADQWQGRQQQTAGPAPAPPPAPPSVIVETKSPPPQTVDSQARELRPEPNPLCKSQPNRKPRPSPGVVCTSLGTPDEYEICGNATLCSLDWQLYSVYQVAMASLDKNGQKELRNKEAAWVKKRGECRNDARCIELAYRSRIDELR